MDSFGNPHAWADACHPGAVANQQQAMIPIGLEKARLTKEQIEYLEARFSDQHKPSTMDKKHIAGMLGVSLDKINNWFQNRRAKEKQEIKKRENARAMLEESMNGMHSSPNPYVPGSQMISTFASPDSMTQMNAASDPYASAALGMQHMTVNGGYQQMDTLGFHPMFASAQESLESDMILAAQNHGANHPPALMIQDPSQTYGLQSNSIPENGLAMPHYAASNQHDMQNSVVSLGNGLAHSYNLTTETQDPALTVQTMNIQPLEAMPPSAQLMSAMSQFSGAPSVAQPFSLPGWSPDSSNHSPAITENPSPSDSGVSGVESVPVNATPVENQDAWQSPPPVGIVMTNDQSLQAPCSLDRQSSAGQGQVSVPSNDYSSSEESLVRVLDRRDSSASVLADTMSGVGLSANSGPEAEFKQPGQLSSLAARRRGPRPAALGVASLRSASYSAGMPQSPGTIAGLQAPDQALRRIRSTGLVTGGRIHKGFAAGQRSPMHQSFAEATASPKFMRHNSLATTNVSSPTASIGTNSLAPPTPSTPAYNLWPSWHQGTPGSAAIHSPDADSSNADVASWAGDVSNKAILLSVSPPETPFYAAQLARYQASINQHMQSQARDTPPQSAPATQQHFPPNVMNMQSQVHLDSVPETQARMSYFRRPSLPGGHHAVQLSTLKKAANWPQVPMFHSEAEVEINTPVPQHMDNSAGFVPMSQGEHRVDTPVFSDPFDSETMVSLATASAAGSAYQPPMDQPGMISPNDQMANRSFYFANQGACDYSLAT